ncbi:MAG: hypothetical protein KDD64_04715 [Bdellovibrionales bacterium]|nr:hypothetical protein [Bdellovibrionales bacterium]
MSVEIRESEVPLGSEEDEKGAEKRVVYTVDSFKNGIAFGQHRLPASEDPRDHYHLRLHDDSEMVRLRSRYVLHKKNPLHELERHLMRLSQLGQLSKATLYLGTTTDPFFPFEGKFDASMRFLELFQRYTPGMLIVQTRSPLIVIAMPIFKRLEHNCRVTMGIETNSEESIARYTPGLPRFEERLKTLRALRRFGITTHVQVSPVLPYGDWRLGATVFAEQINDVSDRVHVRPLTDGSEREERRIKGTLLARRLVEDRKFEWLKPHTANPLISALEQLAPEKLVVPKWEHQKAKQLEMFAA